MRIVAVHRSVEHAFSKGSCDEITLVAGHGVEGDAHSGATVQHLSRVRRDPTQPNLRQVHLIPAEVIPPLDVPPGALGENVTTEGLDLLALSRGALLHLGPDAVVEVTGLRNPCVQIDRYRDGLLKQVVGTHPDGGVVRRAGIMSVVLVGGVVRPGDAVEVRQPAVPMGLEVV